jgi:quinoprotein glucose dehydrogenase
MRKRIVLALLLTMSASAQLDHSSWSDYGGAPDSAQFSSLTQVNRSNVAQLQPAWSFPTGDGGKYSFNPLIAGGLMYVMAKGSSIVALDPATGKQVWSHPAEPETSVITFRGINYWASKDGKDRRLLYCANNYLVAIDAATGRSIPSFGTNGKTDLKIGLDRDPRALSLVQSTTPGKVFEDLIILGSATNQEYDSAPGDIRAYNVRTGKLAWTFHTVPRPGEFGYDSWPKDAWKTVGGANAWGEPSVDVPRGIVYVPTGSPKYNFYGANRKGANLFGDCLLALDARTGKRIWHYQMVHHDIWDYDNTTAPKLLTVQHNGKAVDVVAQAGKQGFVWVFNRVTGEPLWPIEERPVPKSDMPGESVWPTQPFPTLPPPFARQKFDEKDLSPFIDDPAEKARFRDAIQSARNEGLFTPPGLRPTIQMPGNNGGSNWGSAAANPGTGELYVVAKDFPAMLKLEPDGTRGAAAAGSPEELGQYIYRQHCAKCHDSKPLGDVGKRLTRAQIEAVVRSGKGTMAAVPEVPEADLRPLVAYLLNPLRAPAPTTETRYKSSFGFMVTSSGLSAIAPPWSSMTAYDLNTGAIRWKIPLGEVPELAAKGFAHTGAHYPKVGPVVTAGGLIFTGTRDRKARALDTETGKVLWEFELKAALEGIPAVYEVGGREYVVFCAAAQATTRMHATPGHPAANGPIDGAYVAFALP